MEVLYVGIGDSIRLIKMKEFKDAARVLDGLDNISIYLISWNDKTRFFIENQLKAVGKKGSADYLRVFKNRQQLLS